MKKSDTSQAAGRYQARGVSAKKEDVHAAIGNIDAGLFPGAFCKITEDCLTGDPLKCNVIHADGSGTKSALAYLHFREFGDPAVFRGIARDSIVMNIDDLLCVGVTGGVLMSATVNRNPRHFPSSALAHLIDETEHYLARLRELGFGVFSGGGETADVGDLTPTVTVDSCAVAVLPRSRVIDNARIRPGMAIVGLASHGQAVYEDQPNSGIGSNGLTSARHDMLAPYYREKYPETFDKNTDASLIYCGPYRLEDALPGASMSVGEALLSPTRTYAPVVVRLIAELGDRIHGMIHCSGGGQTKCLRFGGGVHYIKDRMMAVPPVFLAIQQAGMVEWREMYQVFNMGHRLEIVVNAADADTVCAVAEDFGIGAAVIGHTEPSRLPDGCNHLSLTGPEGIGVLEYSL